MKSIKNILIINNLNINLGTGIFKIGDWDYKIISMTCHYGGESINSGHYINFSIYDKFSKTDPSKYWFYDSDKFFTAVMPDILQLTNRKLPLNIIAFCHGEYIKNEIWKKFNKISFDRALKVDNNLSLGFSPLALRFGARGVHVAPDAEPSA